MMRYIHIGLMLVIAIVFIYGCVKPFNPAVTTSNANTLVVEGDINTGADSTIIHLSRTVVVNNAVTPNPETGAVITIENAQGTVRTLPEITRGVYAASPAPLDNTKQYRLRIKTKNGSTYLSDLVDAKVTPPIDSIGYTVTANGIQIYANTHDATNNTRYYRYTYRETWQYNSYYESKYIFNYKDTAMVVRTPAQQVYHCFGSDTSAHTILSSTAALSQDVAYQVPITAIDGTSDKIGIKYSILLTQQGISKEAYAFYENIKKNSENLGSIFDAQPSLLQGNIHNIANASETVIGYIGAGTTQKKRIYILKSALPASFVIPDVDGCYMYRFYNYRAVRYGKAYSIANPPPEKVLPTYEFYMEETIFPADRGKLVPITPTFPAYIGLDLNPQGQLLIAPVICGDCTLKGHTAQPVFWK